MAKVTDTVAALARPFVEAAGCTLWDVEYTKEAGTWFLRVYIDKEAGVSIDDCEAVSRAVDPILDQEDPVPGRYHFEVSSAGLERPLRRPEHLAWSLGKTVAVRLYRPRDGAKEFTGVLRGYADGKIVLETATGETAFEKDEIALVRLHLEI